MGFRTSFLDRFRRKLSFGRSQDEEKRPDSRVEEIGPDLEIGVVVAPLDQATSKSKELGWKKLTVVLIVEAIALGCLSIPKAIAAVGIVAGCILTIGLGLIAIYAALLVGEVKIKHPEVDNYPDAVRLFLGRYGYWVTRRSL